MITIQVITIGEVRVSLQLSPLGDATWGLFFQLAQSQDSVDMDNKKVAAQSKPHEESFRTALDCEVQVDQKREQGDCRTGGCVQRRARRLWSEQCSKWSAGRTRGGGRWQNGRISVVQSRLPAHRRGEQRKVENDARLVYSDNMPL